MRDIVDVMTYMTSSSLLLGGYSELLFDVVRPTISSSSRPGCAPWWHQFGLIIRYQGRTPHSPAEYSPLWGADGRARVASSVHHLGRGLTQYAAPRAGLSCGAAPFATRRPGHINSSIVAQYFFVASAFIKVCCCAGFATAFIHISHHYFDVR